MSSSSRPLVTPYLAVIRLTTRQLQLIAEHKLTQDDISLVKNDYALAINRHFHQRSIHQVILSPPGAAKSYYGRVSPEGLHFYAHSVVPSVNGKSPQVNRDIWHHALMDFLLGFPAEVQSEFSKLGVGVIRWPKYFNEPEWLYEDMYKTIHAAKNAQQKVQGEFEFSCESQQRVQDTQSTYM
ncbi:hypothetical protein D9757_012080 [Collybiopsis confluens]|uniref:Uncharacterized protein n=1 Tax=Collybiopsis confluens TaxID=2823264 RepID=A0A8H5GAU1_9AGAR|nr:hypothetical protein D9757_012080 [Collybiopsis confluens]